MVQLFSVQGPGHKQLTNGVIGGDDLKGPRNVARGQGENHLSGRRESEREEAGRTGGQVRPRGTPLPSWALCSAGHWRRERITQKSFCPSMGGTDPLRRSGVLAGSWAGCQHPGLEARRPLSPTALIFPRAGREVRTPLEPVRSRHMPWCDTDSLALSQGALCIKVMKTFTASRTAPWDR